MGVALLSLLLLLSFARTDLVVSPGSLGEPRGAPRHPPHRGRTQRLSLPLHPDFGLSGLSPPQPTAISTSGCCTSTELRATVLVNCTHTHTHTHSNPSPSQSWGSSSSFSDLSYLCNFTRLLQEPRSPNKAMMGLGVMTHVSGRCHF